MLDTFLALSLIVAAFAIALSVLLVFGLLDRRQTSRLRGFSEAERDAIVFIFENENLLDATPAARQLLKSAPRQGTVWAHLSTLLGPRFPRLNDWIKDLGEVGHMELKSTDGSSRIRAEWHDGVARITLDSTQPHETGAALDGHSLVAMTHELESLRASADRTPYPIWREDRTGVITWCNAAYLDLADSVTDGDDLRAWPPYPVFELTQDTLSEPATEAKSALHRVAVAAAGDGARHWFEVSVAEIDGNDRLFTAIPADRLVRAETSLNEFVTTLTKTFASLPIGLAIFDRSRELALFNPALMDLTVLPAEFLISKPTLSAFLDRLRQQRMIPEPKDYKSWRQQMSDLVAAAQNGTYEDTWSLPTGQTYRVTGRPHPDGAVALLFEDISAEISLTRRFRSEVETGQSALDALPEAVAVFSPGGVLSISNSAYAELWGTDPSTSLSELTIADATFGWQNQCAPSPVWDQLRAFVARSGSPRQKWTARLTLHDGRTLSCRATPLARGATLIDFSLPGLAVDRGLAPMIEAERYPTRAEA